MSARMGLTVDFAWAYWQIGREQGKAEMKWPPVSNPESPRSIQSLLIPIPMSLLVFVRCWEGLRCG